MYMCVRPRERVCACLNLAEARGREERCHYLRQIMVAGCHQGSLLPIPPESKLKLFIYHSSRVCVYASVCAEVGIFNTPHPPFNKHFSAFRMKLKLINWV